MPVFLSSKNLLIIILIFGNLEPEFYAKNVGDRPQQIIILLWTPNTPDTKDSVSQVSVVVHHQYCF